MIRTAFAIALTLALFATLSSRATAAEAYFAGGCFWCVESDFESVRGVGNVISGFTGGTTADPEYGNSGDHIESVRIPFDENVVSYEELVYAFFRSVDPTDAGGQFCDRGREYTTAIFVTDEDQRRIAEEQKARAERELGRTVVTPIVDAGRFYPVGDYHQDYYKQTKIVLTRRGPKSKKEAYKFYRNGCGRDQRIRALWGDAAPFVH